MKYDLRRKWPLGTPPSISAPLPTLMDALTIHRDQYGQPADAIHFEEVAVPRLKPEEAGSVLVAILATGPNFNTNFAALGLPVPPFGRGDSATVHIPGSDALGIIVDAGPAVTNLKVGQAVILDSWTDAGIIRGYETHDGFNAQFAVVDQVRAVPVPPNLSHQPPAQLAAMLLTYGTAYRAVVERLAVKPGESILLMGGGKGTSFAGAQIARALGAKVILMGSNRELAETLIRRGIADAFVNRREIPENAYGVLSADEDYQAWLQRTEPFRQAICTANDGRKVDKIFEHTGGINFPLLVSALAENGALAFFGATGSGLKGEYKETFFHTGRRYVMDARWVWMRQKQILFRNKPAREIFSEIGLPPGKKGLVWGADAYAREFVEAALERSAELVVIASRRKETDGIKALLDLGIKPENLIDQDQFELSDDMPDPLTAEGTLNPAYNQTYMSVARAIGRAIWKVFGPRVSPDFIVERSDRSRLHYSSFLVRDFSDFEDMPCGIIIARSRLDLSIHGSHMYSANQAKEVVRLLDQKWIELEKEDLEIVTLRELPELQQKMLDGTLAKPKGVALVQADSAGKSIDDYVQAYLGETLHAADPKRQDYLQINLSPEGIGIISLQRIEALNALNDTLLAQIAEAFGEIRSNGTLQGQPVRAVILCGADRAFVAGADVTEFRGNTADKIARIAHYNINIFNDIERLDIPVIALVDGFALGGGNELAMSCHYRIATENAQIGQPEVKLGIIPGYGGSQRLPRLIGPRRALEMTVNGESVGGREAAAMGLADEFHLSATALARAFQVARELLAGKRVLPVREWDEKAADQREELADLLADETVQRLLATPSPEAAAANSLEAARQFAARIAIAAIKYGYAKGFEKGLANDARLFGEVAASPSGQEWIGRFIDKDPQQSAFLMILNPKSSPGPMVSPAREPAT
ncbi:MAG TPA: enoyl-CoA hydratase-related protein [Desulfuromonadales bacterium]|nr:enoyl-CoA hydratase-related protein [Desulfuromonadales bacterium]